MDSGGGTEEGTAEEHAVGEVERSGETVGDDVDAPVHGAEAEAAEPEESAEDGRIAEAAEAAEREAEAVGAPAAREGSPETAESAEAAEPADPPTAPAEPAEGLGSAGAIDTDGVAAASATATATDAAATTTATDAAATDAAATATDGGATPEPVAVAATTAPAAWSAPQWAQPKPPPLPDKPRMPVRDIVAATVAVIAGIALATANIIGGSHPASKPAPPTAAQLSDEAARAAWRTAPIDTLFPPTLTRSGGEQYVRLGLADPAGCAVLPAAFVSELAKVAPGTSCDRVLRATYADSTETVVSTIGIVVIGGTAEQRDRVWRGWTPDADSRRPELMPGAYAVPNSAASGFSDGRRVMWYSQTTDDGSFLVYSVTGFLDGRPGSSAADLRSGVTKTLAADSPPVQAAIDLPTQIVEALAGAGKKA